MSQIFLLSVLTFLAVVSIIWVAAASKTIKGFVIGALAASAFILLYLSSLTVTLDRAKNKRCAEVSPYTNRCISWVNK